MKLQPFFAGFRALALGLCFMPGMASADEVILKIAHFLPPIAPAQAQVIQPWCDRLTEESDGRLKCQIYPAMQLGGTASQLVDQVRNGVADIVWTAPGYSSGRFPTIEAMELPFMVANALDGSRMTWDYYNRYAQKEFSAFKVLAVHIDGGAVFHTAHTDVKSLADVKGLKLRIPTRLTAKLLQSLGGVPVSMPPAQVTEAIAKGVVDGGILPWELMRPTKIDEVTKFHISPPPGQPYFAATVLAMLMNKQKYDSLPDDLRVVIDRNSGLPLVEKFGTVWDNVTAANQHYARSIGNTVSTLSLDEYRAMRNAAAPVDEEWAKDITTNKKLDGTELLKAARALSVTYFPAQN